MTTRTAGAAAAGMIAMVLGGAGVAAVDPTPLASLVDAERAFARMSVATSQRDAFLEYFADDGVWFVPAPANTKAALRKQAPQAGAPGRVLDWDPITGDVAASGDLGYTTGPWVAREPAVAGQPGRKLETGWFFSVWRWTTASGWRVLADFGVNASHGRTLRAQAFRRADVRAVAPGASGAADASADALRTADAGFAVRASAAGWGAALRELATPDVRTYRNGHEPAVGQTEAASVTSLGARAVTWQPTFALASAAGDIGVTYGSYVDELPGKPIKGYYLHVWKRLPAGWRLAVDATNVESPK
jgi:ketosteroid isomerase-like protein